MQLLGKDLRPGDCIQVWWAPRRDIVIGLERYTGPLAYLFPEGAQIARFALCKTGMTIENDHYFEVIARGAVAPERPCTCHPDDKPPVPCARKYASAAKAAP